MRPEDLLPWRTSRPRPQLTPHEPLVMSDLLGNVPKVPAPPNPSATELFERLGRALFGYPEKILSGEREQLDTPFGTVIYPSGAVDAAAMLPLGTHVGRKLIQSAAEDIGMPFFSQLAKTLAERMPERAAPEQIMNIARKGSKAEELAWSGLEEMMHGKKTVTRDEVLKHLETNAPDLKERMIDGTAPRPMTWRDTTTGPNQGMSASEDGMIEIRPNRQGAYEIFRTDHAPGSGMDYVGYANTIDEAKRMAEQRGGVSALKPRFTQYTLPGGENHRELVVTLPKEQNLEKLRSRWLTDRVDEVSKMDDASLRKAIIDPDYAADEDKNWVKQVSKMKTDELRAALLDIHKETAKELGPDELYHDVGDNYHVPAGHAYNDPELDVNRLFHARMNDRTTADGEKALLMEELQSDWHQTGRKEGYATPPTLPPGWNLRKFESPADVEDSFANIGGPADSAEVGDWALENADGELHDAASGHMSREEAIRHFANRDNGGTDAVELGLHAGGVPDAPFKNTWHELGMKRMLQEAAAGNYDRLAWTTGAQQADRYDLAKYVDKLEWDPQAKILSGYKNGQKVVAQPIVSDLDSFVGKDVANKLRSSSVIPKLKITERPNSPYPFRVTSTDAQYDMSFKTHEEAAKWADMRGGLGTVEGDDLQVGGEGMRGFYDKMLPSYAKKFGKRYGVEPELVEIPGTHDAEKIKEAERRYAKSELQNEAEYFNELKSDELKEAHDAIWNTNPRDDESRAELKRLTDKANQYEETGNEEHRLTDVEEEQLSELSDKFTKWSEDENEMRQHLYDEAERRLSDSRNAPSIDDLVDFGYLEEAEPQKVWSLKITPEMRKDLLEKGQPVFFSANPPVPVPQKRDDKKVLPPIGPLDFIRTTNR